jgi:NTP pyrophosphatase (non-canonical NTP hydrolase)
MTTTISEYQKEHWAWEVKNFGKQKPYTCHLGLIEECGELAHAVLKMDQGIRGTPEQHIAAAKDAVGDILIYLLGYCTSIELQLQDVLECETFDTIQARIATAPFTRDEYIRRINKEISRCWTYRTVGSSERDSINGLVEHLAEFSMREKWSLQEIFDTTWNKVVKKRDWVKDSVSGGEVQGG